jgi:hypothetical protein
LFSEREKKEKKREIKRLSEREREHRSRCNAREGSSLLPEREKKEKKREIKSGDPKQERNREKKRQVERAKRNARSQVVTKRALGAHRYTLPF